MQGRASLKYGPDLKKLTHAKIPKHKEVKMVNEHLNADELVLFEKLVHEIAAIIPGEDSRP